jgi:hypothetical protein
MRDEGISHTFPVSMQNCRYLRSIYEKNFKMFYKKESLAGEYFSKDLVSLTG